MVVSDLLRWSVLTCVTTLPLPSQADGGQPGPAADQSQAEPGGVRQLGARRRAGEAPQRRRAGGPPPLQLHTTATVATRYTQQCPDLWSLVSPYSC